MACCRKEGHAGGKDGCAGGKYGRAEANRDMLEEKRGLFRKRRHAGVKRDMLEGKSDLQWRLAEGMGGFSLGESHSGARVTWKGETCCLEGR